MPMTLEKARAIAQRGANIRRMHDAVRYAATSMNKGVHGEAPNQAANFNGTLLVCPHMILQWNPCTKCSRTRENALRSTAALRAKLGI